MRRFLTTAVLASVMAAVCPAGTASLDLPEYGFQMEPLDGAVDNIPATPVMTFLPSTEGFAPNINVQVQKFSEPLKTFVAQAKSAYAKMNLTIIAEVMRGENEWVVEYLGVMQEAEMHFFARTLTKNGKIYVVTGTCKRSQWGAVGPTLISHVESFKLK